MTTTAEPEPADRRPIAARETNPARRAAAILIRWRVSANAVSAVSMAFAGLAAVAVLGTTATTDPLARGALWIAAGLAIQLRLICNLLDGMVALGSGQASPTGELWNDLPDRVSDTVILVAFGVAVGQPVLGLVASVFAMFTACVRLTGRTAGASSAWSGPMAKPHRMFLLTVCAVLMAVPAVAAWRPFDVSGTAVGLPELALAVIVVGCVITVARRLRRISRELEAASRTATEELS